MRCSQEEAGFCLAPCRTTGASLGWRDIGIKLSVCLCVYLTNQMVLGRSGDKIFHFLGWEMLMFLSIKCWLDAASNWVKQVQAIHLFTLEEWRLDIDGMNPCSLLAACSATALCLSWLVP